jgi:predicted transcriptional regulator of viral defense system
MKTRLGRQDTLLLAYAHLRKLRVLRTGDLTEPLGLSRKQERELYSRLARGGLLARVRPGMYLVPPRLPLGGAWTPSDAEALNALMADTEGRYQICGANTFNRYGFDDQIPNRVYAYNNRISGDRKIGAVELTLIKVADRRLGDTETVTLPNGEQAVYASRVRSLVDAVYDWSRFNGIPRGYQWIRQELKAGRVSAADLVRCTVALRRHRHHPSNRSAAGTRGGHGSLIAEVEAQAESNERFHPVDPLATQTRNLKPPLGRCDERP